MDIVKAEITTPPPDTVSVGQTYKVEGTAKIAGQIGAPPWIYLRVQKKEWWQPSALEDTEFLRGFTLPTDGNVSYDWTPAAPGKYNIALVATPAPLPLPMIGTPPIMGESDMMSVTAVEELGKYTELQIVSYGKV